MREFASTRAIRHNGSVPKVFSLCLPSNASARLLFRITFEALLSSRRAPIPLISFHRVPSCRGAPSPGELSSAGCQGSIRSRFADSCDVASERKSSAVGERAAPKKKQIKKIIKPATREKRAEGEAQGCAQIILFDEIKIMYMSASTSLPLYLPSPISHTLTLSLSLSLSLAGAHARVTTRIHKHARMHDHTLSPPPLFLSLSIYIYIYIYIYTIRVIGDASSLHSLSFVSRF
jgi:hypothetical protein